MILKSIMLSDENAFTSIAVKNLEVAKKFYGDILGLKQVKIEKDLVVYSTRNSLINIYHSQFAGTNQSTCLTWTVGGNLEKIVNELKRKGVKFERYESENILQNDIHVYDSMKVAWFKDPDGNIHNITNE